MPGRAGRDPGEVPAGSRRAGGESSLRVRPAEPRDLEAILQVERESFSRPWSATAFQALMGREQVLFLVLETEPGRVAGHGILWWVGEEGEVANLAVEPGLRGRGAGGMLLDRLLEGAGDAGVEFVFLEVRASNQAAAELYRTRGFQPVGVRRNYYSQPREDARVLRLDLLEGDR